MRKDETDRLPVILPVRRVLMALCVAHLLGILSASIVSVSWKYGAVLCALLLVWAFLRLRVRKRVLFCMLALYFALGYTRVQIDLSVRDCASEPGVMIEGTVAAVQKPYRVFLRDVRVEGEGTKRDVVVTLMREDGGEAPPEPKVGQRVRGVGRLFAPEEPRNPGGYNSRVQAICDGYELSGYLLPGWRASGEAAFSVCEAFRRLREAILSRTQALFGDQAGLFQGIMLGDRSALNADVTAAMRLTGTAHVLTVSGLHLSILARMVSRLLGKAPLGRRGRFAVLSAFLGFFTALTGGHAGTVRACIMAMIREYALVRGRRYEPLTALSAAALLMMLVKPIWALDASFQFSFFCVLGIQLFSVGLPRFDGRRGAAFRLLRGAFSLLAVSLSAQIASVPMQMMLYGYVPLLSMPMNLLCSALMSAQLLGGWGATLLSIFSMKLAAWPARILMRIAAGFEALSLAAAQMDHALLRLPSPCGVSVLLFAGLMMLCSNQIRFGRLRRQAIAFAVLAILASYVPRICPQTSVVQLDVGQGDAAVFRRGRRALLVDVGPSDSYDVIRYLRREGLFVDAVILSHLDEDHTGALLALLQSEIEVPAVIMAEHAQEETLAPQVVSALDMLAEQAITVHEVKRGDRMTANGVVLDVLSPDASVSGSNERSLLLRAEVEGVSFLLAGDLPISAEPDSVPDVDVLKVAHHGSRNATSDAFLEMARPKLAVISVGASNRYGHPHARVLDSLRAVGAEVLRTDESGAITIRLKNGEYRVETYFDRQ